LRISSPAWLAGELLNVRGQRTAFVATSRVRRVTLTAMSHATWCDVRRMLSGACRAPAGAGTHPKEVSDARLCVSEHENPKGENKLVQI
jgi:hypothetical protein